MTKTGGRPAASYSQGVRLVQLLRALDKDRFVSVEGVLEKFKVGIRTLRRDVRALRTALAPFGERVYLNGLDVRLLRYNLAKSHSPAPFTPEAQHLVEAILTALDLERAAVNMTRNVAQSLATSLGLRETMFDDRNLDAIWSVHKNTHMHGLTLTFNGRVEHGYNRVDTSLPGEYALAFHKDHVCILRKGNEA